MDRSQFENALRTGGYGEDAILREAERYKVNGMSGLPSTNGFANFGGRYAFYEYKDGACVAAYFSPKGFWRRDTSQVEEVRAAALFTDGFGMNGDLEHVFESFADAAKKIHGFGDDIEMRRYPFFLDPYARRSNGGGSHVPCAQTSEVGKVIPLLNSLVTCKGMMTEYNRRLEKIEAEVEKLRRTARFDLIEEIIFESQGDKRW